MLAGPIFKRAALTMPRQFRHFLIRSGYLALLFVLMYTAGQAMFGWQHVRNVGDIARFGSFVFQIFSLMQLSLVLFFALLFAAGHVAQEKDRQTLILLLMTDLRSRELVLGKLCASLLLVAVLLLVSVPMFVLVHVLGGVDRTQIVWVLAICAAAALAAGSWGCLVAFWRDKTFQTLAIGIMGLVLYLGLLEVIVVFGDGFPLVQSVAGWFNPYRSLFGVLAPLAYRSEQEAISSAFGCVLCLVTLSAILNGITVLRLRVWNPSATAHISRREAETEDETGTVTQTSSRRIWDKPIIWREIRTRAYGRRTILIKLAYCVVALFAIAYGIHSARSGQLVLGMISPTGFAFVVLSLLSLVLVNAQAVTSLTSERDARTLELLLATNVTAREFIFGKLGGTFYNSKELILIPLLLVAYYAWDGIVLWENLVYLVIGFLMLVTFATMLGLHSGLSFDNSRLAIANSLGTLFFLFVGIFVFMMLLVEARSSFFIQFQSFIVFIGVGSIGLYASLTHRNPSAALTVSAGVLPFLTFYAITEFLLHGSLGVCLAITVAYGFATLAMLIPAVSEFDVALGRTTLDNG